MTVDFHLRVSKTTCTGPQFPKAVASVFWRFDEVHYLSFLSYSFPLRSTYTDKPVQKIKGVVGMITWCPLTA